MDENNRQSSSKLYDGAVNSISYARRCDQLDDPAGRSMGLEHAVELLLDLLGLKIYKVAQDQARAGACDQVKAALERALNASASAETLIAGSTEPCATEAGQEDPGQKRDERGHNPKYVKGAKRFSLMRARGDSWEPHMEGTAAELAKVAGCHSNVIYKNARTGRPFCDGTWKVKAV